MWRSIALNGVWNRSFGSTFSTVWTCGVGREGAQIRKPHREHDQAGGEEIRKTRAMMCGPTPVAGPSRGLGVGRCASLALHDTQHRPPRCRCRCPTRLAGRSIVLVGLMGAGKTSIGRRLAARLGLPFRDADAEIEAAAGCTIPELFSRYGEQAFRDGERRVIRRLLAGDPLVLAFGGGAFIDPETRAVVRDEAVSVWLRCSLPVLVRRVAGRSHRPMLHGGDPAEIMQRLMDQRYPVYAEADVIVDCTDEPPDTTTGQVLDALVAWRAPRRLTVSLSSASYDVVIGDGLLRRAGALLAPRAAAEARGDRHRRDGGGAAPADAAPGPGGDRDRGDARSSCRPARRARASTPTSTC